MNVFRFTFGKELDGRFTVSRIHEAIFPQDLYNKFNWDKIIRMDWVQNDTIAFLSNNKQRLEDFMSGMGAWRVITGSEWEQIFTDENKEKFNQQLQEVIDREKSNA